MREVTLLTVILLLSAVLQTGAAFIAAQQVSKVHDRYRLAWLIVAFALVLMVQRRVAPLWRLNETAELSSMMDAIFGMLISLLILTGVYGVSQLLVGLKSTADTDELTGLMNRRSVLQSIHLEIERALRTHRPIAFLMYDLDHFKGVNDTYGHPAGDIVLRGIAKIATATFRKIDTIGRLGGEEFLVILPDSNQEEARAAAERFRNAVATHKFVCGDQRIEITISIGVFVPDALTQTVTVQNVMDATDKALYAAKNSGRNCVVIQGLSARNSSTAA